MLLETFCTTTAGIWIFIGQIVLIFKIALPVILMIIGIIAFGKAVISDDDKEMKSALTKLVKKIILAVIIFFIPNIIEVIFTTVTGYQEGDEAHDFVNCIQHVVNRK